MDQKCNISQFKHVLRSLCSMVNKILAQVIWKSWFSFYSNIKKNSQHFWNSVCNLFWYQYWNLGIITILIRACVIHTIFCACHALFIIFLQFSFFTPSISLGSHPICPFTHSSAPARSLIGCWYLPSSIIKCVVWNPVPTLAFESSSFESYDKPFLWCSNTIHTYSSSWLKHLKHYTLTFSNKEHVGTAKQSKR